MNTIFRIEHHATHLLEPCGNTDDDLREEWYRYQLRAQILRFRSTPNLFLNKMVIVHVSKRELFAVESFCSMKFVTMIIEYVIKRLIIPHRKNKGTPDKQVF